MLATFCLWSCWPLALFFLILYFTLSLSLGLAWAASTLKARTAITNLSILLVAGHWRKEEVSCPVVVLQCQLKRCQPFAVIFTMFVGALHIEFGCLSLVRKIIR